MQLKMLSLSQELTEKRQQHQQKQNKKQMEPSVSVSKKTIIGTLGSKTNKTLKY